MVKVLIDQFRERLFVDLAHITADVGETLVAAQLATWNRAAVLLSQRIECVTALKGEGSAVVAPYGARAFPGSWVALSDCSALMIRSHSSVTMSSGVRSVPS